MAQHGAWRERRRTLEAEGSALAETLRNLVASNATLKAKYAAELRALTKEDFTIGADVVARWKKSTHGWHEAVVTQLTDKEVTIRYKGVHGRNASTPPSATMLRDKGHVFTEAPKQGRVKGLRARKIATARDAIAAIERGDLPARETRLRKDAEKRSQSVSTQLAAIASDSQHHSAAGARGRPGRPSAPSPAAVPPAVLEGEDGCCPDDTEGDDESALEVEGRGRRLAAVESLRKEVVKMLHHNPERLRTQQVFSTASFLSSGLTSTADLCPAEIIVLDPESQWGSDLVQTPCAICGSSTDVTRHGLVPSLRAVYGRTTTKYLQAALYRCGLCKAQKLRQAKLVEALTLTPHSDALQRAKTKLKGMCYSFRSCDSRLTAMWRKSAPWVVIDCPVYVSHRAAATLELLDLISSLRGAGVAIEKIATNLKAAYGLTKDRLMTKAMLYEEATATKDVSITLPANQNTLDAYMGASTEKVISASLESWKAKKAFRMVMSDASFGVGNAPSSSYLRYLYRLHRGDDEAYEMRFREQRMSVERLSADHSMKAAKSSMLGGGRFGPICLSGMNEFGEIVLFAKVSSTSLLTGGGRHAIQNLSAVLRQRVWRPRILRVAVDKPMSDGPAVLRMLDDAVVKRGVRALPLLALPPNVSVEVIDANDVLAVAAAVQQLRTSVAAMDRAAVGFDVEWLAPRGMSPSNVALLQFASTSMVVLIRLRKRIGR